ncbi:MAG: cytochrome P450 [Gemmataceae bacterium]
MNATVGPIPATPLAHFRGPRAFWWFTKFIRDSVGCLGDAYRVANLCVAGNALPWGRPHRNVFAFGPEHNRTVLGDTATFHTTAQIKGGPPGSPMRRVRHGLTAMNGDEHRQQRQLVMPMFGKKAVDGYRDTGVRMTERLMAEWPSGGRIDAWVEMRKLTLRTSSHILYGREDQATAEAMGEMIFELLENTFSPFVTFLPLDLPGMPFRKLQHDAHQLERTLWDTIARRRQTPTDTPDVLDLLSRAHAEGKMSDAALLGQATILFAASYETQANAMTWTLLLLAQHPAIANDLLDELTGLLHGDAPTVEQLDRLPLLDGVVRESMRIFPTVPYTVRSVSTPTELAGVPLSPGDRVVCSHYVTHHMPEIYANPQRFEPTRWFTIKPTPFEYFPFSAGQRVCIGKYMALMLMKVSLAMIVQRCRFGVVPHTRIDRSVKVTMGPYGGLPMIVAPQDRRYAAVPVRGNVHEMVDLTGASKSVAATTEAA